MVYCSERDICNIFSLSNNITVGLKKNHAPSAYKDIFLNTDKYNVSLTGRMNTPNLYL